MMGGGRSRHLPVAVVAMLLSVFGGAAVAQSTGSVDGQITDADGNPVTAVTVTLFNPGQDGTKEQASDGEGRFRFGDRAYGVYTVRAALDGFDPVTCPGGRVIPGETRSFAIRLMPADAGEQASTCTAAAS
jgi:hypothetical protein